jgi:ABC-type molybdate transport system substrate-binding protein
LNGIGPMRIKATAWERWGIVCASLVAIAAGAAVSAQSGQLTVCHAGSVQGAFSQVEQEFAKQHPSVRVHDVSGGSVALAGRMAAGLQPCDVFAAADYLDIDLLLKPMGLADYTIVFAKGRMVLAYLVTDPLARGIGAAGDFNPPASIPKAGSDWYRTLLEPGVRIAGSHPFLDPSGYRSHMIFQLAQTFYNVPNLANLLLEHYTILPAAGGGGAASAPALGKDYNFQFIYEHSAAAAARINPSYRYVAVPDRIDLSTASNNSDYAKAVVTVPGIGAPGSTTPVVLPATRVAWGLTIPKKSPNQDAAMAFLQLLLGTVGKDAFTANGPAPISPALVTTADYGHLPKSAQSLVKPGDVLP